MAALQPILGVGPTFPFCHWRMSAWVIVGSYPELHSAAPRPAPGVHVCYKVSHTDHSNHQGCLRTVPTKSLIQTAAIVRAV